MSTGYCERRKRLYYWFFVEYRAQNINYRKYYRASEGTRKWGWVFSNFSTVGGALLLILIGGILTGEIGSWATLVSFALSALVAASSYINSSANFYERSNVYYNAGQIHHNLFSEMDHLVKVRLPDQTADLDQIEKNCRELISRKNELNESTPQLPDKWYEKLRRERDVDWEPNSLEEIRDGVWDFTTGDKKSSTGIAARIRSRIPLIDTEL